jgi:hypothetical protein
VTWLTDDRLLLRFSTALLIGVAVNLIAWTLGYVFLPQGTLSGATLATRLPIGETGGAGRIFLEIFLFNLLAAGGASAAANLFRVGQLPLGYIYAWGNWALFGLFLGTDSFEVVGRGKLAPSLIQLLGSKGFYEISAYTLIASATISLFIFRQRSWLDWSTVKERSWRELRLGRAEILALISAGILLFAANLWEALDLAITASRSVV